MRKRNNTDTAYASKEIEAPAGISVATLIAKASNSKISLVLTFQCDQGVFILPVSARYGYAAMFGGPSFAEADTGDHFVIAVRHLGDRPPRLEYAMPLAALIGNISRPARAPAREASPGSRPRS